MNHYRALILILQLLKYLNNTIFNVRV